MTTDTIHEADGRTADERADDVGLDAAPPDAAQTPDDLTCMDVTVDVAELRRLVRWLKPSTFTHGGPAALECVRLETDGARLVGTTTDLETTTTRTIPADVRTPGEPVVVPLTRLEKAAQVAPKKGRADLVAGEGDLAVRTGRRSVRLTTRDADDFPEVGAAGRFVTAVAGERLADAMRRALVASSTDETRPVLRSVTLQAPEPGALDVVATDSYRLAVVRLAGVTGPNMAETDGSDVPEIVVPRDAARIVAKQTADVDGDVTIAADAETVTFTAGRETWTARRIDGTFPSWRQLMPDPADAVGTVTFRPGPVADALKAAEKVLGKDDKAPTYLDLGDAVTLETTSQHVGTVTERPEGAHYTGEPVRIAVNGTYLREGIDVVDDHRMAVIDPMKPAVLGTGDARYLVMPVRTEDTEARR